MDPAASSIASQPGLSVQRDTAGSSCVCSVSPPGQSPGDWCRAGTARQLGEATHPIYGGFLETGTEGRLLPLKLPWKDMSGWWGGNRREYLGPRYCLDIASISPLVKGLLIGREEYPMTLKWVPSPPACSLGPYPLPGLWSSALESYIPRCPGPALPAALPAALGG